MIREPSRWRVFETVLQGILDSSRSLTGADFGLLIMRDDLGQEQDFLASGLTPDEHEMFMEWSKKEPALFEFLNRISGPLRSEDFNKDATSAGFPMFLPPIASNCPSAYLAAPILYQGTTVGSIYVLETVARSNFSSEDEETLVAFASQAAMAIANARRYRGAGPGNPVHPHDSCHRGIRGKGRSSPGPPPPNTAQVLPRVLAVDDDPQALRYVRQTLANAGYEPIVTGDPDEVPHLIKERNPDLVLLDLLLSASAGCSPSSPATLAGY